MDSLKSRQNYVAKFNQVAPPGTMVRYWTGQREGRGKASTTRTRASLLSGHTPVVWVEGESACVALSHVEVVNGN